MPLLIPDYFVNSIHALDGRWLLSKGLNALIVDVDNTILPRDAVEPGTELKAWVAGLRADGIKLVVVSNNWSSRVRKIAADLDAPLTAPAGKPLPRAFRESLRYMGSTAAETAIVGDQLFTDVLGGNLAGITTILVPPVGVKELAHTRVLRLFERVIIGRRAGLRIVDNKWAELGSGR